MTADIEDPKLLTVPALMEQAVAVSDLSDWGDDLSFVPTLQLFLDSCRTSAGLGPGGWRLWRKVVLRHLRNRLSVQAFLTAHPSVTGVDISAPIVITGLPRTGTTLLHNLFALDPANRVLRFWEALQPVPADGWDAGDRRREQLVAQAQTWLERLYALTPEFRSIHALEAEGPEECDSLLQNSFTSQHFDDMFDAPAYSDWLNRAELGHEYSFYGRQLQILTGRNQERRTWVLKSPGHLGYLETVASAFPGCLIVLCHREVNEALASYASLVMAVRSPHTERISPARVGRHVLHRCSIAVARALAARSALGDERFADVAYGDLLHDPVAVVGRIYRICGRALSPEAEAAMRRWLAANPQHKHGRHHYSLSAFGLTPSEVSAAMAEYASLGTQAGVSEGDH